MPQGDVIVGGSVSANSTSQTAPAPNSTANFNASGVSGGSMQVTGTFVGTLVPEGSLTGASGDWQAAPIANLAGTAVTSITAPGFFTFNAETFVFFRLRSTAWTSGTAAVVFKASPGAGPSGGGGGGGGGASTIADGADVAEGATTDVKVTLDNAGTVSAKLRGLLYEFGDQADAAATTDAGTFSFVAFVKRLLSRLTTLLPQTASGLKVDNSAVTQPVSAASLPLPTGAAADATLGTTNTEIGGLTETAPATDTASSGLNGRLQRLAQRLTSLIGLLPSALVSGRLDVNLGAAPATVSAAQSGTWTVQPGNTANTTAWKVDGSAVTQPVSGTVTANAGTGTMTVAGAKTNNNAAPGATNTGVLPAVANAAAPTWTEGNQVVQSVDLAGNQRVIGDVGGFTAMPSITLTRGANTTAYTAQDEVATGGTAATSISVSRVTGQTGFINGARLVYSSNPAVTPSFRLLFFNAAITAAGDNSPLALSDTDAAKYLGHIDFTSTQAGGSATTDNQMMSGAPVAPIQFTSDTVLALLITTNAFTPIANSETIKIYLGCEQN